MLWRNDEFKTYNTPLRSANAIVKDENKLLKTDKVDEIGQMKIANDTRKIDHENFQPKGHQGNTWRSVTIPMRKLKSKP